MGKDQSRARKLFEKAKEASLIARWFLAADEHFESQNHRDTLIALKNVSDAIYRTFYLPAHSLREVLERNHEKALQEKIAELTYGIGANDSFVHDQVYGLHAIYAHIFAEINQLGLGKLNIDKQNQAAEDWAAISAKAQYKLGKKSWEACKQFNRDFALPSPRNTSYTVDSKSDSDGCSIL